MFSSGEDLGMFSMFGWRGVPQKEAPSEDKHKLLQHVNMCKRPTKLFYTFCGRLCSSYEMHSLSSELARLLNYYRKDIDVLKVPHFFEHDPV